MKRLAYLLAGTLAVACGGRDGAGVTDPAITGTVRGEVAGPGGPIPGALVTLLGGGSIETDGDGIFVFAEVEPGVKRVTVSPPSGFALADGETADKQANVAGGATTSISWSLVLTDASPRTIRVDLTATSFSSADVTLPVGSTVNWVNQSPVTHTISPDDPAQAGAWQEVTISGAGTEFDHTFATAGTFDYLCKLHSGMTGVVRVH